MIRVARNAAGNCVIFHGQTNPVYFNACLTAEVVDTDYVSIRNDISTGLGDPKYEYYRIHYSEWQSADFGTFASAEEAVAYINSIGNVTDAVGSGTSFTVGETMDFVQDETQTSILISNGDHHGVNSIRAIAKENGRVGISTSVGGVEWYEIDFEDVRINGSSPGNNLNAVVNALNALFTVTALGAATPAPVYTLQGGAAASWDGIETATPAGGDVLTDFMWGSGDQYHGPRVYTDVVADYIDEPGEYYTFEVENTVSSSGPFLGIGLFSVDNGDVAEITNSNLSNSGHHGYFFSNWLYNYGGYTAPWTTYGSHSSLVYGPGWNGSNSLQFRYSDVHESFRNGGTALFRCGITDTGFVGIWYYDAEVEGISGPYGARSNDWVLCARSSAPVPAGQYGLLVKIPSTAARIRSVPTRYAQDPVAPTLYYRYIESPDGVFHYPLFASAEEAEFVDAGNQSTQHVFVDEPTYSTWYAPATGFTNNGTSAPTDQTYTEIVTEADALHAPPAFTDVTLSVDEFASINYPLAPVDVNYTTSVSALPAGLSFDNLTHSITGTAPEVTGDNVANPSDDYTVTVTRSNTFGSSQGTLTITVANLTAPATAISGFTHVGTSTALVDSDTLDDGSAVTFDNLADEGKRFIIPAAWVETYVLPAIQASGDAIYLGIADGAAVWTTIEDADFDHYIKWEYGTSSSHVSTIVAGGSSSTYSVASRTVSFYDYAFELDGSDVHVIACNFNDINTQPGVDNGGSFSRVVSATSSGSQTLTLAAVSTQMDFAEGTIVEIGIPLGTRTFLVTEQNETTALFDGSTTLPTLNAGTTYRFMYDPSVHSDDVLSFETLDGTAYTTGVTTVGVHGDYLYYVQFAVPSDVPPIRAVWNGNDQNAFTISGSTYTTPVTGITLEGPVANQTGTNLFDQPVGGSVEWGWLSIDEQLGAGQRLVLDNAFLVDLTGAMPDDSIVFMGLKDGTFSTSNRSNSGGANFEGGAYFAIYRYSAADIRVFGYVSGATTIGRNFGTNGILNQGAELAMDLTSSGNNIRLMLRTSQTNSSDSASTTAYADWSSSYKTQTGDQAYGLTNVDVVILGDGTNQAAAAMDTADVDWTGLSEIAVPTPAATLTTNWTKALDFSGSSERTIQVNNSNLYSPIKMAGINNNVAAGTAGNTSNDANARPWATAIVFSSDNNASNQHIWNLGEGAGTTDDNIYLRVDSNRNLYFGWGRSGEINECAFGTLSSTAGTWYGVYVASTGERVGGTYTAADIADCFDIRFVNLSTGAAGSNLSTATNWTSGAFGYRMNREFTGDFTIGGRGANRNFHGKVAAMVVTTLRTNVAMPTDAEIAMMVRDPQQWLLDYKVGNSYRRPSVATDSTNFQLNGYDPASSTQVWLMGDGTSDAYAQIRNQVYAAEQNRYPLNMVSMVSNDIENVTITGLS